MGSGSVPFLWLCGPSGVGKSTVGWEIFAQLSGSGVKLAYVDADQLGLCYPPAGDPDNHRLKASNLGAIWPVFQGAGSRCLIFSGGVDSLELVGVYADQVPGTRLTLCRLRAAPDELTSRFLRRGWLSHLVDEAIADANALDRDDFADVCVDTDGLPVPEVAQLVRQRCGGWPGLVA
jgi:hypothetical protein